MRYDPIGNLPTLYFKDFPTRRIVVLDPKSHASIELDLSAAIFTYNELLKFIKEETSG